MEDDTWSATIMGRGDERSPREADEILWEARTKWRRYTLHQTEYAISSANLLFSYISIAGRLLMPTRPATPLGLLIISFYGPPPPPRIGIARVQESSSFLSSRLPIRPRISSLFDVSSCASTKFAVKLESLHYSCS